MKEYDPENGTYQNMEVDPETKEVHYGELNPQEDKIVYKFKQIKQWHLFSKWWFWVICAVVVIAPWVVVLGIHLVSSEEVKEKEQKVEKLQMEVESLENQVDSLKADENAGTTAMKSQNDSIAYTKITEAEQDGHRIKIYGVYSGIPGLYVCDSTEIDTNNKNIVFAARAADFGADEGRSIIADFVFKGEVRATGSRKKEGFCAIIDSNIILGAGRETEFLNRAKVDSGFFFRHIPLVINKTPIPSDITKKELRRALCSYKDEIVYIEGFDKMTITDFANLLADFGVTTAIYMVGSEGGKGFCRDREGQLHEWGDWTKKDNYKNVTYLIWKKK